MDMREVTVIPLSAAQRADIERRLEDYDARHIGYTLSGSVSLGVEVDGKVVAGADGCMTAFKIFYLSTLYVEEAHRRQGIGAQLLRRVEEEARALGATIIRVDTFDWQGADFYPTQGYERVGYYASEQDGFAETFFVKRLT